MVLVTTPCYLFVIIYSHFEVILSVSLHLAALTIFLLSLEMLMGQMGQIPSPLWPLFLHHGLSRAQEIKR